MLFHYCSKKKVSEDLKQFYANFNVVVCIHPLPSFLVIVTNKHFTFISLVGLLLFLSSNIFYTLYISDLSAFAKKHSSVIIRDLFNYENNKASQNKKSEIIVEFSNINHLTQVSKV